jgi:hypothetical protein
MTRETKKVDETSDVIALKEVLVLYRTDVLVPMSMITLYMMEIM